MAKHGLKRFYGFQINTRLQNETIFVERGVEDVKLLGLGRDINDDPTATPDHYTPVPEELERVVRRYFRRIYGHSMDETFYEYNSI